MNCPNSCKFNIVSNLLNLVFACLESRGLYIGLIQNGGVRKVMDLSSVRVDFSIRTTFTYIYHCHTGQYQSHGICDIRRLFCDFSKPRNAMIGNVMSALGVYKAWV